MMIVGVVRALGIALAVARAGVLGIVRIVAIVAVVVIVALIVLVPCLVDNYGASPFV